MRALLRRSLNLLLLLSLLVWPLQASAATRPAHDADIVTSPDAATQEAPSGSVEVYAAGPDADDVVATLRESPLLFIENVGQFDPAARFQVRGGGGTLWLADDALWITLLEPTPHAEPGVALSAEDGARGPRDRGPDEQPRQAVHIRLSFDGANPSPRLEPYGRSETVVSYFLGSDPEGWRPDVPVWSGVRYADLYPGIDLVVGGGAGRWTWRMEVDAEVDDPDAALAAVQLRVEGADSLSLSEGGLQLETAVGALALPLLQSLDAEGQTLAADAPRVEGFAVAAPFALASLTPQAAPAQAGGLVYSTFLGGSSYDEGYGIAVDGLGQAHVIGSTSSSNFPVGPGYDTDHNIGDDVFVAKLNAAGTALLYATFLGGSSHDEGYGIAVDALGQAYVTGSTASRGFPAGPGYDTGYVGNTDAFVVKLNAAGTALLYATFLGGHDYDRGTGIAVDGLGQAYVTGHTKSAWTFPVGPGYDTDYNGYEDCFVVKLNAAGTALLYSTFLGGSDFNRGHGIAVDAMGQAYVTGYTTAADFPAGPGYDTDFNGGWDAFVVKLNAAGTALLYSTFLGGGGDDTGSGIAVDGLGQAYVTGRTWSFDFPAGPGYDTDFNGYVDAFVVKLNAAGTALLYATYVGGSRRDRGWGIAVDAMGQAYVTGTTSSPDFPAGPGYDTDYNGNSDVFVAKLNAAGTALLYATFLGGSDDDGLRDEYGTIGTAIAVDAMGRAYATASTYSADFPSTPGAYSVTYSGCTDAFVTVLQLPETGPHTISGRVIDGGGQGLGDVMVGAAGTGWARTDAMGYFTLTGVVTGTHTLTPSLAGYSFSPAWRTVTVPPGATVVSFYGWPQSALVDPLQSSVMVDTAFVEADGVDTGTITVTLRNANGDPVPGKGVTLLSDRGYLDDITQPAVPTDSNGRAVAYVRSSAFGVATLQALVSSDGVLLAAAATVTFAELTPIPASLQDKAEAGVGAAHRALDEVWANTLRIVDLDRYFHAAIGEASARRVKDLVTGLLDVAGGAASWHRGDPASRLKFPAWRQTVTSPEWRQDYLCKVTGLFTDHMTWGTDSELGQRLSSIVFRGSLLLYGAQRWDACMVDLAAESYLDAWNIGTLIGDVLNNYLLDPPDQWYAKQLMDDERVFLAALLTKLRSTRMPAMTEELEADYWSDLAAREKALRIYTQRVRDAYLTLDSARSASESGGWAGDASLLSARLAAKALATYAFDGPGRIAVAGILGVLDYYMNTSDLRDAELMVFTAEEILIESVADAMHTGPENVRAGMDQIIRGQLPDTPEGSIVSVEHWSQGEVWGLFRWKETGSYSTVTIQNTGTAPATFYVVSRYLSCTTRLKTPWSFLWESAESDPIVIAPGDTRQVRVDYRTDTAGFSPMNEQFYWGAGYLEPSPISIDLIASNDTGVFYLDYDRSDWWPVKVDANGVPLASTAAALAQEYQTIAPPLEARVYASAADGSGEMRLWATNPYTVTVPITVTQTVSDGITPLELGGADYDGTHLQWSRLLDPLVTELFTWTWSVDVPPGTEIQLPASELTITGPDGENLVDSADPGAFLKPWPISIKRAVPVNVTPGTPASIVVTATNVTSSPVDATLHITATATTGEPHLTGSYSLALAGGDAQTITTAVPTSLPAGSYAVVGSLEAQGGTKTAFEDLMTVGVRSPALAITGSPVQADGTIVSGQAVTLSAHITNRASVSLSQIVITATVPLDLATGVHAISDGGVADGESVIWGLDSLAAGDTRTLTFQVHIPQDYGDGAGRYLRSEIVAHSAQVPIAGGQSFAALVVGTANTPPIASAGPDQSAKTLATVQLDASASTDPDGHFPLLYQWTQTDGPAVQLSNPSGIMPTFVAPGDPCTLGFSLVVTDALGAASAPDSVSITITNQPPVADAGPNQTVPLSTWVSLDGTGSSDPDGDLPLAYWWNQIGGLVVSLDDPTAAAPSFLAPSTPTSLVFTLVVMDSLGAESEPDSVTITVRSVEGGYTAYLPLVLR